MTTLHIIVKWNPFLQFHPDAPDSVILHCNLLEKFSETPEYRYVWWGKISKTHKLGVSEERLRLINEQLEKSGRFLHLYLYCPDGPSPSLHVGKLHRISFLDKRFNEHTPDYYNDIKFPIPVWFKITDIVKVDMEEIENLLLQHGERFDPVSSNSYPLLVDENVERSYFIFENHYQSLKESSEKYSTVFISYGGPDAEIAIKINEQLTRNGVKTWFFPRDAPLGEKLHRVMSENVLKHDRVLLICSKSSLNRPGVQTELERVLEREAQEGGTTRLIPITIDDYVFADWAPERPDLAAQIRSRVIARFPVEPSLENEFGEAIRKLIEALRNV